MKYFNILLLFTIFTITFATTEIEIETQNDKQIENEQELKQGFFDKKDFEYCSTDKRHYVVLGLTIGYPIGILCISTILLGLGRRIPIINIFISPCIFSALVVMIDRIVCNEDITTIWF